jgi:hypothetical protein
VGDHLMRRCIVLLGILASFSLAAAAQGPQGVGADSYGETAVRAGVGAEPTSPLASPWRFAFGYQYNRIDLSGTPFTTLGANISASRLFTNWLGVEGQAGFGFGNSGGTTVPSNLTAKTILVAAGPRVVYHGPGRRLEFWAHGLVGMEHFRFSQTAGQLGSNTGLAGALGGGVDLRLTRSLTITGEADQLATRLFNGYQFHFQAVTSLVFRY